MEEVGASTQPRFHFSRGTLADRPRTSFLPRGKNCNSTISGEQFFSDIVSTSSSIFTADRFSDFSDGYYFCGPSIYTTNSVVPEGVLASSYSNVGGLYSCSSQTTASSSAVVTEVQPFDRCTSGPPRFHTDSLHRRLPNMMGCTVSGVWEDCHLEEHINLLLIATDNTTVVALSSESRRNSLLFSVSSMQRNYVAMQQSPDSVDSETCPRQSESNSGCIFSIPCSSEYGMGFFKQSL